MTMKQRQADKERSLLRCFRALFRLNYQYLYNRNTDDTFK